MNAENNGLKNLKEIEIDATPPNITNFGAFPGIFRPGFENVTIKYTLVKKADVTIEIWDNFNCIRKLTIPEPGYGDNCSAMWDGRNECGGLVSNRNYSYKINAVDEAGNSAVERVGKITATDVTLTITKLNINPSRFTPDPDTKDMVDFWTNFHVEMEATDSQLQNLGFCMNTNQVRTLPYILVNMTAWDAQAKKLMTVGPDLTCGDSDPFTNGYPLYYTGNMGTESHYGVFPKLGSDLPDVGDRDKGNDWDTLVPLQRTGNKYWADWGVGIKDWDYPNGTYIIRVEVKLIGSTWKFIDYVYDAAKIPIAEKWHQEPDEYKGYSRNSGSVEGRIEVVSSPITKPDYIAPEVVATTPGLNTIHEPGENISVISAKLIDIGNAGVDLTYSEIILKDSIGMVIPGKFSNNGVDTMKWVLEEPLTSPDDYTIEVKPVDKSMNGLSKCPQRFTFTILDRIGPKIDNILVNDKILEKGASFGPNEIKKISVILSEIGAGKSKVDFPSSKIMVRNELTQQENEPNKLFGSGNRREEKYTEDMSGVIIYENLTLDKGGTYSIWVEAWDRASTPNAPAPNFNRSPKITFYVSSIGYINVEFNYPGLGTRTYLMIPPNTTAYPIGSTGTMVSTNTITMRQGTITTKNENYTVIDPVIEFWWFNNEHIDIKLDPPIGVGISLTMYYGHITLPPGVTEDNLAIWRYNGTSWGKISGVNDIDKNNNKITVNLPLYPNISLEDSYAIMYLVPKAVDVQYEHYQKGLVTCLKVPEATMVDGYVVGTNTVTAGTLTETRDGYVIIEPVIQFFLKGNPVTKSDFTNQVTLIMYYTDEDVANLTQRGLKASDLAIYEYNGTTWAKISNGILDENNKQITWTTKIIRGKYAIMYVIPVITDKPAVFEASVHAYPNPIKGGRVTFRYDLIRDATVNIKIYTLMGDLVWNKEYSPTSPQGMQGSHGVYPSNGDDIIWNCTNNADKKVATGLYIYRLTASDESGEVTVTKKLIVVQ
ncbi:MAG: hypothetical protein QME42_03710 [bacterium]|nr:hypothetical protein [bacterium]